jgi:AcrR family transcriptional regulator
LKRAYVAARCDTRRVSTPPPVTASAFEVPHGAPATESPAGESGTPRRRRGPALEDAILDAAHAELAENSWEGFTVEGVAARSGAAKSVIYRRWRSRVELAVAVLQRANAEAPDALASHGDLRSDLLEFLIGMAAFLRTPFGEAVRGIERHGDTAGRISIFGQAQVTGVQQLVDRAVTRGELDHQPSVLALNVGHSIVMMEFLHLHHPPADDELEELVDTIWLPALRRAARAADTGAPDDLASFTGET